MRCVWCENTSDGRALAFPAPDLLRRLGKSSIRLLQRLTARRQDRSTRADHHHACRSPTWGSPTSRLLEALLPAISTSVLRALQRAQQLRGGPRNRLGSSRFRLPGHCSNRVPRHNCKQPKLITPTPYCAGA
jgi:hypothetical protein